MGAEYVSEETLESTESIVRDYIATVDADPLRGNHITFGRIDEAIGDKIDASRSEWSKALRCFDFLEVKGQTSGNGLRYRIVSENI